jgi:hypothetical protein
LSYFVITQTDYLTHSSVKVTPELTASVLSSLDIGVLDEIEQHHSAATACSNRSAMTIPASMQDQTDDSPDTGRLSTNEREQRHKSALCTQSSSRHTSLGTSTFACSITNDKALDPHDQEVDPNASTISNIGIGPCEAQSDRRPRPILATLLAYVALCVSIFLVALDTVLIPTALPTISRSFHIPDSLYAWTGSAYLLANAASVPLWGKLADVFGRKNIILVANVIFLGGSVVCATSVSAAMLVVGRSVQGIGGGGVVVLVHVIVSDLFDIWYVASPLLERSILIAGEHF